MKQRPQYTIHQESIFAMSQFLPWKNVTTPPQLFRDDIKKQYENKKWDIYEGNICIWWQEIQSLKREEADHI